MQDLGEQIFTIERALGERMVDHAQVIVRSWLNELGEENRYEHAFLTIQEQYHAAFQAWLAEDTEEVEDKLNSLTADMYQLVDSVYASIRLHRGISPRMYGCNRENLSSVLHYYSNCVLLTEADLDWLRGLFSDSNRVAMATLTAGALAQNLRECFNLEALLVLIDGMNSNNRIISEHCAFFACSLLIQYDIRVDFFPQLQDAFVQAVRKMEDDGEEIIGVLMALIRLSQVKWEDVKEAEMPDDLPQDISEMIQSVDLNNEINHFSAIMPESEAEFLGSLVQIFPDTWLYKLLIQDDSARERMMALLYLSIGRMDLAWDHPDVAEKWLQKEMRKSSASERDYMNYAHCMLLKGDRIMAYEYYRQARSMCKNVKDFFAIFRPDRKELAEHGVPLDYIYLLEDMLLKVEN